MVLCDDQECGVCFQRYTRTKRVPRMLFCKHTFCTPCLGAMAEQKHGMLTIRCPLCRQVSCLLNGHTLQEVLWINSHLWDSISHVQELEEEEEEKSTELATLEAQANCGSRPTSNNCRSKLRFRGFVMKLLFPQRTQERIIPVCDV